MNLLWNELAAKAGLALDEAQQANLSQYLDLLIAGNERMNLTRIVDRQQAEVQHVGDSLTVLPYLPAGELKIADVGTGGGVPGIPLAIVRSESHVTLIESTKKKATFLRETIATMGLTNVTIVDERAEDIGHTGRRANFDVAVARAVAEMAWLVEWCLPLVRKNGKLLAMKGQKIVEELPAAKKAIKLLGGSPAVVHKVDLPGTEHLVIVEIKKIERTDNRYPRPATMAKGKAIG